MRKLFRSAELLLPGPILGLLLFITLILSSQMPGTSLSSMIAKSNSLIADDQADLPAYHVHYEIRAWDYRRNPFSATYDVYRNSAAKVLRLSQRGGFSDSVLTLGTDTWVKRSTIRPLRLSELADAFPRPASAYTRAQKASGQPTFTHRDQQGEPLVCGTTGDGLELCFDQARGLVASARIKDQTIRYGDWLPIGNHFVPGIIEMRLGDRLLFSAQGSVVSPQMDESLFIPQPGALQMGGRAAIVREPSKDAVLHSDSANPAAAAPSLQVRPSGPVFGRIAAQCPPTEMPDEAGSAQVIVEVDKRGLVREASIEDADSEEIAKAALENARQCRYEPHLDDGHPVAFQSFLVYVTPSLQPPLKK